MPAQKTQSKKQKSKQQPIASNPGPAPNPAPAPRNRSDWSPKLEFYSRMSADGRYVIHKTIITSIKPRRYMEKVLEGKDPSALRTRDKIIHNALGTPESQE